MKKHESLFVTKKPDSNYGNQTEPWSKEFDPSEDDSYEDQTEEEQEGEAEERSWEEQDEDEPSEEEQLEEELSDGEQIEEELIEGVHFEEDPSDEEQEVLTEVAGEKKLVEENRCQEKKLSSQPFSDNDVEEQKSGHVQLDSNEKKRPADLVCIQSRKKHNQEVFAKEISQLEPHSFDIVKSEKLSMLVGRENSTEQQEAAGSSGKKKRSRWDIQSEYNREACEGGNEVTKRRKTRWAYDDTELKILGPLQLPDFTKDIGGGTVQDREIQKLNAQLIDINQKLLRPKVTDDRPKDERSPSPEPVYNELGIRINTREVRFRAKLVQQKLKIISKLVKRNKSFNIPSEIQPPKFYKKLYIPTKEYPEYNFVGLIIGPRGNNQKRMEMQTGAKIMLRGKGSSTRSRQNGDEDLHVLIEADNEKALNAAVEMVEKILVPVEGQSELKRAQLRELAVLRGTIKPSSACNVCGDLGHSTRSCPLTVSVPGTDDQSIARLGVGGSLFSLSTGKSNTSNAPVIRPEMSTYANTNQPNTEIDETNVYVCYLPQSVDETRLSQLFSPFGPISKLRLIRDPTGVSKGYGFVKYHDSANAARAVEHMNKFRIEDKILAARIHKWHLATPLSASSVTNPAYPATPAFPQAMPSWVGSPGPTYPSSCAPFPQGSRDFSHDASQMSYSPSPGLPYATQVCHFASPGTISHVELANFAGNPEKSSISLFSKIYGGNESESSLRAANSHFRTDDPRFSVHPQHQLTKNEEHFSAVPTYSLSPAGIEGFPGNPDRAMSRFLL